MGAQGATTPVPEPDEPPLLEPMPPPLPLQITDGGACVVPAAGAGLAMGLHGGPGGTLTGEGIGIVTLGPELPATRLQPVPPHVHVWSYRPLARCVTAMPPKTTTEPVAASYADAAPVVIGGVVPG